MDEEGSFYSMSDVEGGGMSEKAWNWGYQENKLNMLGNNIVFRDFPGGPVVKNPPPNAGDVGSIPGRRTKIPHATGQLSLCTPTTYLARARWSPRATTTEKPVHHNKEPAGCN